MAIAESVQLGEGVKIHHPELVNLYGCRIGDHSQIGPFVEIQKGVEVGRLCKISSHSFLCEGLRVEDEVFIGHGVMFINDRDPKAAEEGRLLRDGEWTLEPTRIGRGASIGSGATILGGLRIGRGALVGAGAVVTRDVPEHAVVMGSPARVTGDRRERRKEGS